MITITARAAQDAKVRLQAYDIVAAHLGEDYGLDTPIPFKLLVELLPWEDVLWAFQLIKDKRFLRHLACDYAERALPIFESPHPDDKRPRKAIEVARRYADGLATKEELNAAWYAARDAAEDAAWAAAWRYPRAFAREAAWAARAVAEAVAEAVAWRQPRAVAWYAAEAAGDAEQAWQKQRLLELLEQEEQKDCAI